MAQLIHGTTIANHTAIHAGNLADHNIATTSYVTTQINNLINGAPGALNTLDELAAALGDDSNFATTVTNSIATKLPLAGGTMSGNIILGAGASLLFTGGSHSISGNSTGYLHFYGYTDVYFNDQLVIRGGIRNDNGDVRIDDNLAVTGTISASGYNSSNWDTAFSWGNHAGLYAAASHNHDDRYYTESESDSRFVNASGDTMSGRLTLSSISGVAQTVPNDFGAYLHLGDWGVGRTATGAVLVNTAYRADYATEFFDMNISRLTNNAGYITQTNAVQPIYGNSGAHNLNVSDQHANIRFSQGVWVNPPIPGNFSHVLSFNQAPDHRTVQLYLGDVPGALYWRMAQGSSVGFHPWERIWTSTSLTNLNQLTNGPGFLTSLPSHNHDDRYYTESESDSRFVNVSGDTMTGALRINGSTNGGEVFAVDGVNGRLFTVTDDLSDSLFSVNTIAGLPVIEAFANNIVNIGPYSAPVIFSASGIATPSHGTSANWFTAFNKRPTGIGFSGSSTKTLTLTLGDGSTLSAAFNDIDTDTNSDGQTLSISGSTLSISGGNSITIPSGGMSQADADTRYLRLSGGTLTGDLLSTHPFYPGYNNGGVQSQGSFYFYGNTSNSGIRTNSNFLADGDIYLGTRGNWLSTYLNQAVQTGSSPTFSQVYSNNWFRNNASNTGLYNETNANHFYSRSGTTWSITGAGGNIILEFRSNHESTLRGSVYADTNNQIGFLNNGNGWSFRTNSSNNAFVHGPELTINSDNAGSSNIIMNDGDEGNRIIHCNSNRIGFLNQAGSWGAWCDDAGNWITGAGMYAATFYDQDNTAFYVNPGGSSRIRNLYIGDSGSDWSDPGGWGTQLHVSHGPHSIIRVYTRNEAIETVLFSHGGGQSKVGSGTNHNFSIVRNFSDRMVFYNGYTFSEGYLQAADSLRAPIFYDSNNTGYYIDPDSRSNIWTLTANGKDHYFGTSGEWDGAGFSSLTNVHMQGHSMFWFGAGNAYWYRGAISTEHDLLITTMQGYNDRAYYRGITFAVDVNGNGNTGGYRLGRWQTYGSGWTTARLQVDASLSVGYGARGTRVSDSAEYPLNHGVWQMGRDQTGYGADRWREYLFSPTANGGGPWGSFASLEVSSPSEGNSDIPALFRMHQWGSGAVEFWKPQGRTLFIRESPGGGGSWFDTLQVSGTLNVTSNQNTSGTTYAAAYRGNANVGGTGEATWHPAGIYTGGAQWMYGVMYKNNSAIYDISDLTLNGTASIQRFNAATLDRHSLNSKQVNSPWATRAAQGVLYQTGAMGWGQNDFNVIGSNWGSGFFDTWSSPGNAPGGSSHYVGLQAFHYSNSDSSRFHGWQMACAQEATNRWFWRSAWDTPRAWVEMIHSGNIGGQSVNYATQAGTASNANTVGGIGADAFFRDLGFEGGGANANTLRETRSAFTYANGSPHTGPIAYFGASGYGLQLNATYHGGDQNISYRVRNGDNGTFKEWYSFVTSANIGSQTVSNSDMVDGFHMNQAVLTTSSPTFQEVYANGWFRTTSHQGLYNPTNDAHFYPNNFSHGAWKMSGQRNGWRGLHFGQGTGMTLMMNESEFGFHREAHGWTARFTSGHFHGYANSAGRANQANGNFYVNDNYGNTVVGLYDSYRLQGVWAMGDAYKLAADGTNGGDLYGLAWSHPNAGGQAGFLSNHGLIMMMYGTAFATLSDTIWCRGDIIAFSDARVKTNIQRIENPIDKVMAIRGVTFTRTDIQDKEKRHAGVIAQEVLEVLPEVVNENKDNGHYSVAYGNLSALLIEAIKEQQAQIEELRAEVKKLKGE